MEALILVIVLLAWAYFSHEKKKKQDEENNRVRVNKCSVSRIALEKFGYNLIETTTDDDGQIKYFYNKIVNTDNTYISQFAHVYDNKKLRSNVWITSNHPAKELELQLEADRIDENDLFLLENGSHPRAKIIPKKTNLPDYNYEKWKHDRGMP